MANKVSFDELKMVLSRCLSNDIDRQFSESLKFLLKKRSDNYYFYGRAPVDAAFLQIQTSLLKKILVLVDKVSHNSLHVTLNSILQSALLTHQTSVFLYGRMRQ